MNTASQAKAIRAVANDERVGSIIEAARILPLVGWDTALAIDYYMEEIAREIEADDRRYQSKKTGTAARARTPAELAYLWGHR